MMKLNIYQINKDRDTKRIIFCNLQHLKILQGSEIIDRSIYDKVYSGMVDCRNLEDVFMVFNLYKPDNFKGHSLSVSDVVEIIESDVEQPGFYFCDSFGFTPIDF